MTGCEQNKKNTMDTKHIKFYIYKYKYFYEIKRAPGSLSVGKCRIIQTDG